ncbi:hypothetical protein EK0264_06845 [Epidermidibacterium keratini]|uniref:Major facilitator superfamily (MFS) profile domain-containing protein n=1 Tax=Epidermidibacterium keratini TaxID=1891644 RepID=A0A7L4YLL4_9ACTN|nr:hypothetical protein [Epidermidibacterium keratini]QHC00020.1 hypothetical protein EK0264_06845 [Epidermidibacterium keratini]
MPAPDGRVRRASDDEPALPGLNRLWFAEGVSSFGTHITLYALQVLVVAPLAGLVADSLGYVTALGSAAAFFAIAAGLLALSPFPTVRSVA